ncbi:hypothetical protein FPQ18DRAFT_309963 [Pyronema domesticum]|uniref:Uncharacterized protein n=1 Tax=Pyronema omphalodes (strain CBS 100304) TaxID=1076935 RepID=U4L7U6_PYROM|nr:hypothetical protein FPQ18DRAFT_309963 [Pyronema domesticum]CCX06209.1 Protein of unknown function [Pyronema omphalodes CBS 100304]
MANYTMSTIKSIALPEFIPAARHVDQYTNNCRTRYYCDVHDYGRLTEGGIVMCCDSFVYRDAGVEGKFFDCLEPSGKLERIGRLRNELDLRFPLSLSDVATHKEIICDSKVDPPNATRTGNSGHAISTTFITQTLSSTSTITPPDLSTPTLPAPTTTNQNAGEPTLVGKPSNTNTALVAACSMLGSFLLVGLIGSILYFRFKKKEEQKPDQEPSYYNFRTPPSPSPGKPGTFFQEMSQPTPGPSGSPGHLPIISPDYHHRTSPDDGSPGSWAPNFYQKMSQSNSGESGPHGPYGHCPVVASDHHHTSPEHSPLGNYFGEMTQPISGPSASPGYPDYLHHSTDNPPDNYFRGMPQQIPDHSGSGHHHFILPDHHPPSPGPSPPGPSSPGPLLFRSMPDPTPGYLPFISPDNNSFMEMDHTQCTTIPLDDNNTPPTNNNPSSSLPQPAAPPTSEVEVSPVSEPPATPAVLPAFGPRKQPVTLLSTHDAGDLMTANQRRPSIPESLRNLRDVPPTLPMINPGTPSVWGKEFGG